MKLKHKLLLTFLAIGLLPVLLISIISSYVASNTIEAQAFSQLISVRDIKKTQIENYFSARKIDLEILASTLKDTVVIKNGELEKSESINDEYFQNYIKTKGYYDFFLIDQAGNVFYTVAKEADYQSNLINGDYSDSGLGKLFRKVSREQKFAMSDFSRYAPSNNEPAAFIAYPFTSKNGVSLVVALQLSIEQINKLMQQRSGMGKTGESYLIGKDLLMRSDSYLDPKGHSVMASFAGNVKNNGVDTEAAHLALSGQTGHKIIIDYNGNPVLSAYTPVDINGIRWGLLSEIDVAEAFAPVDNLHIQILVIILFVIALIVAIAFYTTKSILKPLGGEPDEMQNITETIANGDLTIKFENDRPEKSVYGAMHKMTKNLHSIVDKITRGSNELASVSDRTSTLSLQSTSSLQQQQMSIEQVATAVEEMTVTIDDVAKNASNVSSSAQSAQHSSNEANTKLNLTINDLNKLDNEIEQASTVIQTLESDSHQIGSVLEVIRGIAEQTNLLALNAAIEAARAGEQGRGFAVVADEVRNLASKTQESTKNIEDMIGKLQSASNNAVQVIVASRSVCEETQENAKITAQAIHTMNEEINTITQMTELIATAVEEQSLVSSEISHNVTKINDVAAENSASSEQVSSASQEMKQITDTLNQLTLVFKLS